MDHRYFAFGQVARRAFGWLVEVEDRLDDGREC
jgi:hypothetical protein